MSSLEMKILKALLYVTTLKDISQRTGVSPQAASYHLKKLVKDKKVAHVKRGSYCLTQNGKDYLKVHQIKTQKKFLKNEQTVDQTFVCSTFLKTEKEVLTHIVVDTIKGEKNITGAYLAWKTGLSRGWISEILKRLREKGLITSGNLKTFKVHIPTIAGVQLISRANAAPPDEKTVLKPTAKNQKIQTRPQILVFEAPVLEGPENLQVWITVPIREKKGHFYYDYTVYVQGVESGSQRVVRVYVPGFTSPDFDKGVYEAFKRVTAVLKILGDYHFKCGHPKLVENKKELVVTWPSESKLQMWVRPHEYLVQIPIVKLGNPDEEWQTYRMKGWDCIWVKDVDGNVMLTPKSALAHVPPLTMKTPDLATYEVQEKAEQLVKKLEASQYAFSENMEPKKGSIAIVNDPFALYMYENIEFLDEKDLSSGPLKIDKSTGPPELESTDPQKCSIHIGNIWDFYEGVAGGSIDLDELKKVVDGNPQLVKLLTIILEYQAVFSKNLATHVEAVKDIKEATENLKEVVKSKGNVNFEEFSVFGELLKKTLKEAFKEAVKEAISDNKL